MKTVAVAIIGAGFSGIAMARRLQQSGIDDFVILEKASKPGGTWRDNSYPGVACDVPSHLYCLSSDPNPDWSHVYSPGAEIQDYVVQIIGRYGLDRHIRYGFEVRSANWQGSGWKLTGAGGEVLEAEAVVCATGVLHHPAYPAIEGLGDFAGPVLHTARWQHDIILEGRRAGVIGTGTTASQLVPAIASDVASLTVFQRTPNWILGVPNRRTFAIERGLLRLMPGLLRWGSKTMTTLVARTYGESFLARSPITRMYIEHRCRRMLSRVRDPELRKKLTPSYSPGCKRLVFTDGYYEALQRPNVELVTEPISHVTANGVVTKDGKQHALDVLILATGFRADAFMRPMSVTGLNGVSIEEVWESKPVAYRSVSIPSMPNFFLLIGPYSPIANVSVIEVAEWQSVYIQRCIELARQRKAALSASKAATKAYGDVLDRAAPQAVWASGCSSWYLGPDRLPSLYSLPPLKHRAELLQNPDLRDFDVLPLAPGIPVATASD